MKDPSEAHQMSWQELLWCWLSGNYDRIEVGANTRAAEDALGLGRSTYAYVGYSHPEFGAYVVSFSQRSDSAAGHALVSPFDTGGLHHGRIPTQKPQSAAELQALVARNSFPLENDASDRMQEWLDQAFQDASDYALGERPSTAFDPIVDVARAQDARAWAWEGRLDSIAYGSAPILADGLYMAPGQLVRYIDWTRLNSHLFEGDLQSHLSYVRTIYRESENPVLDLTQRLKGALR